MRKPTLLPHHESYKHASRSAQYVSSYQPGLCLEWSGERLQIREQNIEIVSWGCEGEGTGGQQSEGIFWGFILFYFNITDWSWSF